MKCLLEKGSMIQFIDSLISADKVFDKKILKKSSAGKNDPYLKGSISNYAKDLIMTFPVLCDNTLPPSTASMISKANERNVVSMLQLLFAAEQFNGTSGREILSTIYKNVNINGPTIDDAIDKLETFTSSSYEKAIGGISIFEQSAEFREVVREMTAALKTPQVSYPTESFSENSLNDYKVLNIHGKVVVKEDVRVKISDKDIDDKDNTLNNAFKHSYRSDKDLERYADELKVDSLENDIKYAGEKERRARAEEIRKQAQEVRAKDKEERDIESDKIKNNNMTNQSTNFNVDILTRQLLDTDVKKSNEMTPTLMIIRYNELNNDNKIYGQKSFVAGVKSRLIPADSSDIIERIIAKNKTKLSFVNLIRATTGEINIVRDFLLCIDQAKIDAKNSIKKGEAAKMWKALEVLSTKNNRNKIRKSGNDASCITTLVVNQETVNIIKKQYDFDLERVANAKMVMDAYNLLGIIIADESIEVVKFLYAGNDMFEQQAYTSLERESNDSSYKKVINLIGKMNGR